MKICVISFTQNGEKLQNKILPLLSGDISVYDKTEIKTYVREMFQSCDVLIFIGAAAIAVRLIAPHLKGKDVDPAVIVLDEMGSYAIPLLSGHLGGANEFCVELCKKTGSIPVITTATDLNHKFKVDVWSKKNHCTIADISKIKYISMAVLQEQPVGFYSEFEICGSVPPELSDSAASVGICVSVNGKLSPFLTTLNVIPKVITIGVGCRKNTGTNKLERLLLDTLDENGISIPAVEQIASIDLKKEETAIVEFARKYSIPFITYTAEELNSISGEFEGSDFVKTITGTDNVCERSAALASGGEIILKKKSLEGITVSLAKKDWKCNF